MRLRASVFWPCCAVGGYYLGDVMTWIAKSDIPGYAWAALGLALLAWAGHKMDNIRPK
jgi:hypothetical protein